MSAFGGKADIDVKRLHFRFLPKGDMKRRAAMSANDPDRTSRRSNTAFQSVIADDLSPFYALSIKKRLEL